MRNGQLATSLEFLRASTGFHENPFYLLIMIETTPKKSPNIFIDRNAKVYCIAQLMCHSSKMGDDKLLASPAQRHSRQNLVVISTPSETAFNFSTNDNLYNWHFYPYSKTKFSTSRNGVKPPVDPFQPSTN
jgi:hypothetical protein